jgi:hypothetical protein
MGYGHPGADPEARWRCDDVACSRAGGRSRVSYEVQTPVFEGPVLPRGPQSRLQQARLFQRRNLTLFRVHLPRLPARYRRPAYVGDMARCSSSS